MAPSFRGAMMGNLTRDTAPDIRPADEWPGACAWLERVRSAAARIEPLVREIAALRDANAEMLPWQTRSAGNGACVGAHSDPTASEAERRIQELGELIADRSRLLEAMQAVVGECGGVLADMAARLGPKHALALELYYVDLADTWSEVADEMGISYRWLCKLRNEAYSWIETHCRTFLT